MKEVLVRSIPWARKSEKSWYSDHLRDLLNISSQWLVFSDTEEYIVGCTLGCTAEKYRKLLISCTLLRCCFLVLLLIDLYEIRQNNKMFVDVVSMYFYNWVNYIGGTGIREHPAENVMIWFNPYRESDPLLGSRKPGPFLATAHICHYMRWIKVFSIRNVLVPYCIGSTEKKNKQHLTTI